MSLPPSVGNGFCRLCFVMGFVQLINQVKYHDDGTNEKQETAASVASLMSAGS